MRQQMKKTSDSMLKAINKYNAKNTKQYVVKLNRNTDEDLINFLDQLENKQGFIKNLLRQHLQNEK